MTEPDTDSAVQRLYDAATAWSGDPACGSGDVIAAACQALVDGVDSPTLRDLAGASVRDSAAGIRDLVTRALDELMIPAVGTLPPGCRVAASGGVVHRPSLDTLHLAIAPTGGEADDDFQVLVYVNDTEITTAGAGLGMDPNHLLIPTNRLVATSVPRTVGIARCECGVYGCGATDVTITRGPGVVHWDWSAEVPMSCGVSFPADLYDAEVARIAADHTWETPACTAGRLILTGVDHQRLRAHGLKLTWAANDYRDHARFQIALQVDDDYQVFLSLPWHGENPEALARRALATLQTPPATWDATWQAIKPALTGPPPIAGPSWQHCHP
ncbi:MAG: hypothetical protein HKP61_15675 [Dactylosporangium sp.]|nr:hypothetical protein [Dactylosporangium sp.]NNJ62345.1 hypothetical protein [Dactylosporangium sp.]